MAQATAFRELNGLPKSIDDVLWPDLDPEFYHQCREGLMALTAACEASSQSKTSFYVGAGISVYKPSRLPVAYAVINSLFEECVHIYPELNRYLEALHNALDESSYVLMENIFQHLYECVHPNRFHAGRVFDVPLDPPRFNVNHTFLAHWLQSGRGTVITPNLDPLIEHAWRNVAELNLSRLNVIHHPTQFEDWNRLIGQSNVLWKLHGSSDDPESWAITLSRVGFTLDDARADFLKNLISEHNVCFIGYRAADLDLYPPILDAHKQRKQGQIFWVFYFQQGYRTLTAYLQNEPNIAQLFEVNPECIYPIVTTAERLSTWIQMRCLNVEPVLSPEDVSSPKYDYRRWFAVDLQAIGEQATQKLIGYTFRTLGKHDEALTVLDAASQAVLKDEERLGPADELLIERTAQVLQESAQTSWQKKDYMVAITKVKRAQKLLQRIGNDIGGEFGLISMTLDAKVPIKRTERIAALVRLIKLHWRFTRLSHHSEPSFSPILGQGLCIFHEAKTAEQILKKTPFLHIRPIRLRLIAWYGRAERLIKQSKFPNSIPDVKGKQAFLWLPIDANRAAQEMIEAIRIAQTISQAHHELSVDRARLLLEQIENSEIRLRLLEAIGDVKECTEIE